MSKSSDKISKVKGKPLVTYKTIRNMRVGDRFHMGWHSSMMIKTDVKVTDSKGTKFLAVSENGLSEWLKDDQVTYMRYEGAHGEFLRLSGKIKQHTFDVLTSKGEIFK